MNKSRITIEQGAYLAAFFLALSLRLLFLGESLLLDDEAALANQSLDLLNGGRLLLSPQPGYILTTAVLFFLFESSEWLARLIPALLGASLVLSPLLFRDVLGKYWALLAAVALALDPGLVAISRQANGILLAAAGLIFFWGFWRAGKARLAGASLGVGLLGGPSFWLGAAGLLIAFTAYRLLHRKSSEESGEIPVDSRPSDLRQTVIFAGIVIFTVGSALFLIPTGISAAASSLPEFLLGWTAPSGVPAIRLVSALTTSELLFLLLALASVWNSFSGWKPADRFLGLWWVAATLLVMIYPGRQVRDLVWTLIPMIGLAARQAPALVRVNPGDWSAALGQFALASILLFFSWFNLLGVVASPNLDLATLRNLISPDSTGAISASAEEVLKLIALFGGLVLLVLTTLLVAWGWRPIVAWQGLVQASVLVLFLLTLSSTGRSAGLSVRPQADYWNSSAYFLEGKLMVQTIQDLSRWNRSEPEILDITLVRLDTPSLRWALRSMREVTFTRGLGSGSLPSVVIAPENVEVNLEVDYRGQDFVYSSTPAKAILPPRDWPRWLAFRDGLMENQALVLWVRSDLFPDNAAISGAEAP